MFSTPSDKNEKSLFQLLDQKAKNNTEMREKKIIDLINRTKIKYIVQGFLFNYYYFFFLHWKFYSNKESVLVGGCVCTILNT